MYIHGKCRPDEMDLDYDKVAFGYCGLCGIQGTIYHVKGSDDYYKAKKGGVTREFRDGKDVTDGPGLKTFAPKITVSEDAKLDLEKEEITVSVKVDVLEDKVPTKEEQEVAESIPDESTLMAGSANEASIPEEMTVTVKTEDLEKPYDIATEVIKKVKESPEYKIAKIEALEAELAELKKKAE